MQLGWYGIKIERKKLRRCIKKMSEETLEIKYVFLSLCDAEVQRLRVRDSRSNDTLTTGQELFQHKGHKCLVACPEGPK